MEADIVAEFGVEGGGQEVTLADGDDGPLGAARVGRRQPCLFGGQAGEDVHVGPNVIDDGGADEDGVEGGSAEGGNVDVGLEAVDLAAVGVATKADVQGAQGGVRKVGGPLGEDDQAGAGAPDRESGGDQLLKGLVKLEVQHEAAEAGALAARDDEAVELGQVVGFAHLAGFDAQALEDADVLGKVALKGKNADAHSLLPIKVYNKWLEQD